MGNYFISLSYETKNFEGSCNQMSEMYNDDRTLTQVSNIIIYQFYAKSLRVRAYFYFRSLLVIHVQLFATFNDTSR